MRLVMISLLLAAPGLRAAEPDGPHYSKPAVRAAIIAVVDGQLAALRAGDFPGAYRFAAAPLRKQFSVEAFAAMITRGYPDLAHSRRAEPGLPMDDGEQATLSVRVFAAGGQAVTYRYILVKEPAGWRIAGVLPENPRASDA